MEQKQAELINDGELQHERPLRLCLDSEVRWNSTYRMIERAHKLRKVFQEYDESIAQEIDWILLLEIMKILKPLSAITQHFSSDTQATVAFVSCVFPTLPDKLRAFSFTNQSLTTAVNMMIRKLSKYEEHIQQDVIYLATILDPRVKLSNHTEHTSMYGRQLLNQQVRLLQNNGQSFGQLNSTQNSINTSQSIINHYDSIMDEVMATLLDQCDDQVKDF